MLGRQGQMLCLQEFMCIPVLWYGVQINGLLPVLLFSGSYPVQAEPQEGVKQKEGFQHHHPLSC